MFLIEKMNSIDLLFGLDKMGEFSYGTEIILVVGNQKTKLRNKKI
jgi:hypothetical protein